MNPSLFSLSYAELNEHEDELRPIGFLTGSDAQGLIDQLIAFKPSEYNSFVWRVHHLAARAGNVELIRLMSQLKCDFIFRIDYLEAFSQVQIIDSQAVLKLVAGATPDQLAKAVRTLAYKYQMDPAVLPVLEFVKTLSLEQWAIMIGIIYEYDLDKQFYNHRPVHSDRVLSREMLIEAHTIIQTRLGLTKSQYIDYFSEKELFRMVCHEHDARAAISELLK